MIRFVKDIKMKRIIAAIWALLLSVFLFAGRQDEGVVKGKVEDSAGTPLGFATVFITGAGDAIVAGDAADADGRFALKAAPGNYKLTVSLIGYKDATMDISLTVQGLELPPIRLEEDSQLLESATVQAVMPKTKLTGDGLQTNIRGSVLENAGTANDVLAKTPGIIKGQNGLEVIGKGSPLVYINGRKVTDPTELDRLQSNEIQSIEVISNPGAQYDATVRSVVRIRTVRRQGDGFGFNVNASDAQSLRWDKGNDPFGAVNLNYRTGGLDLFAGVNYQSNSSRQISDSEATTYGKSIFENKGSIDGESFVKSIYGNAGANWQIADNHFLGGKVEWGRSLQVSSHTDIIADVLLDHVKIDELHTLSDDVLGNTVPLNLGANIYYNGRVGDKLGIDVNLDYYGTDMSTNSTSEETSPMTHGASISSVSENSGRMYAGKAVFTYPIWQGQLEAGTEETFSRRSDVYSISGVSIPASSALVKEDNYAGFVSYGCFIQEAGQFKAGVRYEYVRYAYEDALNPASDLTKNYSNWFPNASYAGVIGPVQLMLNYSAKTRRPNYANLSSAIRYNSRYVWQSGNARLQPELSHNVSLTAVWKFIAFVVNYTYTKDAIMTWSAPYNDEGVVLVKPRNIDEPFHTLPVFVNLTPTFGPWSLNYTLGIMPQWLSITVDDPREPSGRRVTRFNDKPIFLAQLFNTLTVDGGWQFELGNVLYSKGYTQNMMLTNVYFDLTAAVQKTLLKDGSLVLRLEGHDLTGTAHNDVDTDFGSHTIMQTNIMDTQRIKLSLRYNFNTAKSKYRGTGAGADQKARM